jgi:hypothetical protein
MPRRKSGHNFQYVTSSVLYGLSGIPCALFSPGHCSILRDGRFARRTQRCSDLFIEPITGGAKERNTRFEEDSVGIVYQVLNTFPGN